jgi:hypothetical protein
VIGADGLHPRTRAPAFGPEEQFHRYLGYCFAGFTMPNTLGLSHEGLMWTVPGRAAAMYAVGDHPKMHGFLNFALREPPFAAFRDPTAQRDLVAAVFADDGLLVSEGDALLFPTTADALARRNAMPREGEATPQATGRPEHSAFTLPAFAA